MIRVKFDIVPPTATAQQKGVFVHNGRAHFFTKQKVRDAEDFLAALLAPHAPAEPLRGGIYLQARARRAATRWNLPTSAVVLPLSEERTEERDEDGARNPAHVTARP